LPGILIMILNSSTKQLDIKYTGDLNKDFINVSSNINYIWNIVSNLISTNKDLESQIKDLKDQISVLRNK